MSYSKSFAVHSARVHNEKLYETWFSFSVLSSVSVSNRRRNECSIAAMHCVLGAVCWLILADTFGRYNYVCMQRVPFSGDFGSFFHFRCCCCRCYQPSGKKNKFQQQNDFIANWIFSSLWWNGENTVRVLRANCACFNCHGRIKCKFINIKSGTIS